ncbi:uncharacterized protein LOC141628970, partial [Silene latifolia]|uniref:uncharacterized protein LOC141628970 n=1 Tax=Silene latifolia TaxID=37657 RepID=UPI003D783B37
TTSLITFLLYNIPTLFSLPHITHSLLTRVSSLRSSRGDTRGARRAHILADKVKRILGRRFGHTVLSLGWTYIRHYTYGSRGIGTRLSYRNFVDYYETVRGWVTELARLRDDVERVAWVQSNYKDINGLFKAIYEWLLSVLITSEPLKKVLEEEMEEGDLLKDCLEVGGKELKGLFQILKDLASQFNTTEKAFSL